MDDMTCIFFFQGTSGCTGIFYIGFSWCRWEEGVFILSCTFRLCLIVQELLFSRTWWQSVSVWKVSYQELIPSISFRYQHNAINLCCNFMTWLSMILCFLYVFNKQRLQDDRKALLGDMEKNTIQRSYDKKYQRVSNGVAEDCWAGNWVPCKANKTMVLKAVFYRFHRFHSL